MLHKNFVAIDFETATGYRNSACAIGLVCVENGVITDQYYALIQPPENAYWFQNIRVHDITPEQTEDSPTFDLLYPEIYKRIAGKVLVAHSEGFDRSVLRKTMEHYHLDYAELELSEKWECTCKIYKKLGYKPAKLSDCCRLQNIELNHHHALSDAIGCAKLYLLA